MSRSLAGTAAAQRWLDPVAERLQARLQRLLSRAPASATCFDGVWFGAPLDPVITDAPLVGRQHSCSTASMCSPVTWPRVAAAAALAVGTTAAVPAAVTGLGGLPMASG
jgi:hypothetical protein